MSIWKYCSPIRDNAVVSADEIVYTNKQIKMILRIKKVWILII